MKLCNRKLRAARAAIEFLVKKQAYVNLTYADKGQDVTVSCSQAVH